MAVSIEFRGVMMFHAMDGTLRGIYLPDADEAHDKVDKWAPNGQHPDGSVAVPHFAGLVLQPAGTVELRYISLSGLHLDIVGGTGYPVVPHHAVPTIPPGLAALKRERATARVDVAGGTLTPHRQLAFSTGTFLGDAYTHASVLWTSAEAEVQLVAREAGKVVWRYKAAPGDKLVVYSYDAPRPSLKELDEEHPISGRKVDNDFKWLYSLLERWPDHQYLPAPALEPRRPGGSDPGILTVSVFTCFPGLWTGAVE